MEKLDVLLRLYPELERHGGVEGLLNEAFAGTAAAGAVVAHPANPYHAEASLGRRDVRVSLVTDRPWYLMTLSEFGLHMATVGLPSAGECVQAVRGWLLGGLGPAAAGGAAADVKLAPCAEAYARGMASYVDCRWALCRGLAAQRGRLSEAYGALVEEAARRPALRSRLPELERGFFVVSVPPERHASAAAVPVPEAPGRFRVTGPAGQVLGEGDARHAVDLLEASLPHA
jgi:hypothetical protein